MFLSEIQRHSELLGDRTALASGAETISWAQLWPMAQALAAGLRRSGTGPVAVMGDREPWVPADFLACLIAGRPYLPCPPSLPAGRRAELLVRTGAEPLERLQAERGFFSGERCEMAEDTDRTAYLLFTSGSTGGPKQVAVSVSNLDHFLCWARTLPGVAGAAAGVVAGQAAYTFDLSVADLYLALTCGGTHLALRKEELSEPAALFRQLGLWGANLLVCTPSLLRLCLLDSAFTPALLPELKAVFSCGEVLPHRTAGRLLERFPGIRLFNAYGPTECTCAVCAAEITRDQCTGVLPVGVLSGAAANISLEKGEIVIRGESVAPAYGETYHTGDLGHVRHGRLYWDGRKDFQIKFKGYRIEPAEIEAALESLEGVGRAAVLPRRDSSGQVRGLTAFIEGDCGREELAAALQKRLPAYMVPGEWRFLQQIPLNDRGKCDRRALEEMLYGGRD